ncbi:hypothetical protein BD770DRAFT_33426 [Pilaira anomala]|nr:hypothetical protein BD770DRAFT_33426 [Pilaira anomala]
MIYFLPSYKYKKLRQNRRFSFVLMDQSYFKKKRGAPMNQFVKKKKKKYVVILCCPHFFREKVSSFLFKKMSHFVCFF